jgi:hypothetical protein
MTQQFALDRSMSFGTEGSHAWRHADHTDHVDYPRPQLRRGNWSDLGGAWSFTFDDDDVGLERGWSSTGQFERSIQVPFPPESPLSGVHDSGFHPRIWYARRFGCDCPPGDRVLLHFGAVDYRASVWLNGRLVARNEGGHVPFVADITEVLETGEQLLVVRAEDDPSDLTQPRGKQYWEEKPGIIYYHRTTGIWQPVWVEIVPRLHVTELRWTPDLDEFGVHLVLRLSAPTPSGAQVRIRLAAGGKLLAEDICLVQGDELRRTIKFDRQLAWAGRRRLQWSPSNPNLIDADIEVFSPEATTTDRVGSYFGLRAIAVRDGRFHLNGSPLFLRMVLAQNYWPQSHLAAPSGEALRREVELAKELGFNGVRIHQKIEDPRFLYWCDRLGVMVWAEAPSGFVFDDRLAERLSSEWMRAVRRDFSHPSIIAWVPHNESWGVPNLDNCPRQLAFVRALYNMTKALDGSRPVLGNDGWSHAVGDIFGVHDYAGSGDLLRERYRDRAAIERTFAEIRPHHNPLLAHGHNWGDEPVVISEFGGLSLRPAGNEDWFGYGQFQDAEAFATAYEELVSALLDSTALAGFCYTQLTDTEQETNGLLTAERAPKLPLERVHAITTRPARAIPPEVTAALLREDERRRGPGDTTPAAGSAP